MGPVAGPWRSMRRDQTWGKGMQRRRPQGPALFWMAGPARCAGPERGALRDRAAFRAVGPGKAGCQRPRKTLRPRARRQMADPGLLSSATVNRRAIAAQAAQSAGVVGLAASSQQQGTCDRLRFQWLRSSDGGRTARVPWAEANGSV